MDFIGHCRRLLVSGRMYNERKTVHMIFLCAITIEIDIYPLWHKYGAINPHSWTCLIGPAGIKLRLIIKRPSRDQFVQKSWQFTVRIDIMHFSVGFFVTFTGPSEWDENTRLG